MVAYDESLLRALVDVATSHITLLVAHVDTEEALSLWVFVPPTQFSQLVTEIIPYCIA